MFCFFVKQKTAYEMRISDWSSDVCSSDLRCQPIADPFRRHVQVLAQEAARTLRRLDPRRIVDLRPRVRHAADEIAQDHSRQRSTGHAPRAEAGGGPADRQRVE